MEPFRRRDNGDAGEQLRDRLSQWAAEITIKRLERARPAFPEGVEDRDADVWESLLAIADEAGGDWPARARAAAIHLVGLAKQKSPSLGLRLLADIRKAFHPEGEPPIERMATVDILAALNEMDEAPWGDLRGKPLDARSLSRRLSPYEIAVKTMRTDAGKLVKGYRREDFHDAWLRYLPRSPLCDVTDVTDVTDPMGKRDSTCPRCAGAGCEWCAR